MTIEKDQGNGGSAEVVPPIYRLGSDRLNKEVITEGQRTLTWRLVGGDAELAIIAGWNIFPAEYTEGHGTLQLPLGTRNASGILAGKEAWEGEKGAIVDRVVAYLRDLHRATGLFDIDFAWAHVGITPAQDVFIAPPNAPATASATEIETWQRGLVSDLDLLLQNDELNRGMVELFAENLQRIH